MARKRNKRVKRPWRAYAFGVALGIALTLGVSYVSFRYVQTTWLLVERADLEHLLEQFYAAITECRATHS